MDLQQKNRRINNFYFNKLFCKEKFSILNKCKVDSFVNSNLKPQRVKSLEEYYDSSFYKNNQNLLVEISRINDLNSRYKYELSK